MTPEKLTEVERLILSEAQSYGLVPFSRLFGTKTDAAQGLTRRGLLVRKRKGYGCTLAGQDALKASEP